MPLFANHPSGHEPPATLTDAELEASLVALRHKLRSARRSLLLAHAVGATLTVVILGAGFAVLSAGPAPFFERFLGHAHETTTFDAVAWWLVPLLPARAGGPFGDQLLRGKRRRARGWGPRVRELEPRGADAEAGRRERGAG